MFLCSIRIVVLCLKHTNKDIYICFYVVMLLLIYIVNTDS